MRSKSNTVPDDLPSTNCQQGGIENIEIIEFGCLGHPVKCQITRYHKTTSCVQAKNADQLIYKPAQWVLHPHLKPRDGPSSRLSGVIRVVQSKDVRIQLLLTAANSSRCDYCHAWSWIRYEVPSRKKSLVKTFFCVVARRSRNLDLTGGANRTAINRAFT